VATKKKLVYIPMAADLVHPGHLNIIRIGAELGEVVVGLLTDEAIAAYKRVPVMSYADRHAVVSNLRGVSRVEPQEQLDYRPNLRRFRPHYLVHGSDWQTGVMSGPRQLAIDTMAEWGGKVVEPAYTPGVSSSELIARLRGPGISPSVRLGRLSRMLTMKPMIRALEAHNGLSALIVENTTATAPSGSPNSFDAIWISSLTDSLAKGKRDDESVDFSSRLATINHILEVTTKPLIVDGDTGGRPEHFAAQVKTLERLGVSAVVIEDKTGLKYNSLHPAGRHVQATPAEFAHKLRTGVNARVHNEFIIIARIESLILGFGVDEALERAHTYLQAGAGAIMIHSKDPSGTDIMQFAAAYGRLPNRRPLMVVPTSYAHISETQLQEWGVNIVVYANHLLRAAYPAMLRSAQRILEHERALEADELCIPVPEFLSLTEQ
jgi:phosphoenolpyruvate mutase